jgi:hypothetical protein
MLNQVLILLAIVIIGTLATYAVRLKLQVRRQEKKRQQLIDEQNARLMMSIDAIARAMRQEQCPLSEGCLRLAVLLDHLVLQPNPAFAEHYPNIHEMVAKIQHMPTHEARKQRPKAEIRQMDQEREALEEQMADEILADVERLLDWADTQVRAG